MISNCCNPDAVGKVSRWDRKKKEYIEIDCPTVVQQYNKYMGGVDLSDMLISLYRTSITSKRWYLKVLFHCGDIAKVNAWLIYRRYCNQLEVPKKSQISLLKFTMAISSALTKSTTVQRVGRPSKRQSDDHLPLVRRKVPTPAPVDDIRYDNVAHWPEFREKKINVDFVKLVLDVCIVRNVICASV